MKLLKAISRTPLFKITSLNSVSVVLKIGTGLISSKVLAIFVGPAGLALVTNLRNFLTSVESVSTLGFQNGIIKYVTENKTDDEGLRKIISTFFITLLVSVIILSILLFGFSGLWNDLIFGKNNDYLDIFKILAVVIPWYAVTILMIAMINGFEKFKNVIYINIIGNIAGLIFSVFMVWKFRTFGALVSLVIPPALLFFAAFYFINKEIQFFKIISIKSYDGTILKNLLSYSLMALVSSVGGPLVFIAIRNQVISKLGIDSAGYWESISRISASYFMFISTILAVYFLPKLAFARTKKATRNVLRTYYTGILPIFMVGLTLIYFFRFFIIKLLFTSAFFPVAGLFFWQLIGDVFKAAALILGYQFFAKKLTTAFIVSECFSLMVLYFSSIYAIKIYGLEGIVIANAFTYFIYLIVLAVYFRKNLF